jgi:replicative DNA helicase
LPTYQEDNGSTQQTQQDALSTHGTTVPWPSSTEEHSGLNETAIPVEKQLFSSLICSTEIEESMLHGLRVDDFSIYQHQLIFDAMCKSVHKNNHCTIYSVSEILREGGALYTAGGENYLIELSDIGVGKPLDPLKDLISHVKRCSQLRRIERAAKMTLRAIEGNSVDLATVQQSTRQLLKQIEKEKKKQPKTMSAYEGITKKAVETFKPAVVTGWPVLDAHVKLSPGRLAVLGARPGMGKTTLATQLSAQVLKHNRESYVLYCSVEMDAAEIGVKAASALSQTDCVSPFQNGNKESIEMVNNRAGHYSQILSRLAVFYGTRLDELLNIANHMHKEVPLGLIVCDFISSIHPGDKYGTRSEAIGHVSKALKQLARDLQIPVLACSQLNRGTGANRRPTMKDLRDSGEIEQDADIIMLLHREDPEEDRTVLMIEKNRFGTLHEIHLDTQFQFHRFSF